MNHGKLLLVTVFVVTLGAGVMAGLLAGRFPAAGPTLAATAAESSPLAEQLGLSSEQRVSMRKIWEGVRDLSDGSYTDARKAQEEKEKAIDALIPADKVDSYNSIKRAYTERCAVLDGRRKVAFEKAVQDTRKILSPAQQAQYEEILKKRLGPSWDSMHQPGDAGANPAATQTGASIGSSASKEL